VIDLHSHILPGLDDGVRDLTGAVELARAAAADGVTTIAATPHVRDDYPTTPEHMEAARAAVVEAVANAGVDIRVVPGGELALTRLDRLSEDDLRGFQLGGDSGHLLVETPYRGWPLDLHERVLQLRVAGWTPVLAHPERNDEVQEDPERLRPLVRAGVLVQLTAASVDGRLGRRARRSSETLLELRLAHLIASDAHAPELRGAGLAHAAAAVGDDELASWLTRDVPAAVLAGRPPPPRPEVRRRRRRLWR
jgi:protein-tyrosine phosphatase